LVNNFGTVGPVGAATFTDAICLQLGLPQNGRQSRRLAVAITVTATSRVDFIAQIHAIEFYTDWKLRTFSQDRLGHTVS